MPTRSLTQRLAAALVCPNCHGSFQFEAERLTCERCAASFPILEGIPVFLPGTVAVVREHISNPTGPALEARLREAESFTLHLVVGDAHRLPFRPETFDRVLALNVFEHLRDPRVVAAEILRVLKLGGTVRIQTAFLQALHESPNHFYNATEFGVREWFHAFQIDSCEVSGNFGPGMMLGFLSSNILGAAAMGGVTAQQLAQIGATTISEWAQFWADPTTPPAGFATLQNLPQAAQTRIAAGFELIGRKPACRT